MTDKQIMAEKKALPPFKMRNKRQEQLYKELSCREMINSIMVYGNINSPYDVKKGTFDEYLSHYMDGGYFHIGRERVLALIKEQQEDFKKAVVNRGCYTDHEGCTYNSCVWADEM